MPPATAARAWCDRSRRASSGSRTDHIDLLFLHVWDDTAPADEILRGFDDLVRQGKVPLYRHFGHAPRGRLRGCRP